MKYISKVLVLVFAMVSASRSQICPQIRLKVVGQCFKVYQNAKKDLIKNTNSSVTPKTIHGKPINVAFDCVQKRINEVNCLGNKKKRMANIILNVFKPSLDRFVQYINDHPEERFDGKSAYICAARTFGTGKVKPLMKLITGIQSKFSEEVCSTYGEIYELVGKAMHDNCRNARLYDQVKHLLYISYSNLKECMKYDSFMSHDTFSNHVYPDKSSSTTSLAASSILILLTSIILVS